jgi:hypothetical protein
MEKVKVDKDKLFERVAEIDRIYDFPVKDMANEDRIPILRVKKASLDDQIKAEATSSITTVLLRKILEQLEKGEKPDISTIHETINHPGANPKTSFEIHLFQKCVVEPKFTIDEAVKLSETMPDLVNEVCAFALGLRPEIENNGD